MLPLLADGDAMPALPWPYVLALCAALGGAIIALWRRDVDRENKRADREKEVATAMVDQARGDGQEVTRALAAASASMSQLAEKVEENKAERAAIGREILDAVRGFKRA